MIKKLMKRLIGAIAGAAFGLGMVFIAMFLLDLISFIFHTYSAGQITAGVAILYCTLVGMITSGTWIKD